MDNFKLKLTIQFCGTLSFICCLAYILNLVCKDILAELKLSNSKEAHVILKAQKGHKRLNIKTGTMGIITKLRLVIL